MKVVNVTASLVCSQGWIWPSRAERYCTTSQGWRICSTTSERMLDSKHLVSNLPGAMNQWSWLASLSASRSTYLAPSKDLCDASCKFAGGLLKPLAIGVDLVERSRFRIGAAAASVRMEQGENPSFIAWLSKLASGSFVNIWRLFE